MNIRTDTHTYDKSKQWTKGRLDSATTAQDLVSKGKATPEESAKPVGTPQTSHTDATFRDHERKDVRTWSINQQNSLGHPPTVVAMTLSLIFF